MLNNMYAEDNKETKTPTDTMEMSDQQRNAQELLARWTYADGDKARREAFVAAKTFISGEGAYEDETISAEQHVC